MAASKEKAAGEGKYARICELGKCQKPFRTNRKHKKFCSTEHQQEYWRTLRGGKDWTEREITRIRLRQVDHEDRIRALEEQRR